MAESFEVTICCPSTLDESQLRQWDAAQRANLESAAVFQSLHFVSFLSHRGAKERVFLFVITNVTNPEVSYFVPARLSKAIAPWSTRARWIGGMKFPVVEILGGQPNMPHDLKMMDELFSVICSHKDFRKRNILMPFLAKDSFAWSYVANADLVRRSYNPFVLHGFRESHSVEVPPSMEAYYKLLTRKKRYNLQRQERLLREHLKTSMEVVPIDKPEQLKLLFAAMKALNVPGSHESTLGKSEFYESCSNGLTLCYVMMSGSEILGLAVGIKSQSIYYLQRFYYKEDLKVLSVGTVLWQVILRDIIENRRFVMVEMGYSSPTYNSRAINGICERGEVFLIRKSVQNLVKLNFFVIYSKMQNAIKRATKIRNTAINGSHRFTAALSREANTVASSSGIIV